MSFMSFLAEQIENNPYFVVIGWSATVIAFILGIIFFLLQRKHKSISFTYRTIELVSKPPIAPKTEGLSITYNGEKVDNLSVTSCRIFNSGNVLIEEEDLYTNHKLKISPDNPCSKKVLFANIRESSSDTIGSNVDLNHNGEVIVLFQSLEKNECIELDIYHTLDADVKFKLEGKIKNGGKILNRREYNIKPMSSEELQFRSLIDNAVNIILTTLMLMLMCLAIGYFLAAMSFWNYNPQSISKENSEYTNSFEEERIDNVDEESSFLEPLNMLLE